MNTEPETNRDYPSVTQVLGLVTDFSNIRPEVLEHASQRGTQVHAYSAAYSRKLWVPRVPEDCAGYFQSFVSWSDTMVEEVLFVETEFIDDKLGYIGHPDLGVILKGGIGALIDLKTPVALQKVWKAQLAAYLKPVQKKFPQIKKAGSLRLDPDGGTAKMAWYDESERDFAAFVNLLFAFKYFK